MSIGLLTACSGQPVGLPYGQSPKFQLVQFDTPAAVAVKPAEQGKPVGKGTETLVVNISQFLAKFRRVLAVPASVNKVVITVTAADGTVFSEILDLASLTAGQTSVTFNGLVPGEASVRIQAYDASNQMIGSAENTVRVAPGTVTQMEMGLSVPSPQKPMGGSGGGSSAPASTGGIDLDLSLRDASSLHTMLRTPLADSTIEQVVGGVPGSLDGPSATAATQGLGPVAVSENGEIYFVELWYGRLRKVALDGWVSTLGEVWRSDPHTNIALGAGGKIYFGDDNRNQIRVVDTARPAADPQFMTAVAGAGTPGVEDGSAASARFTELRHVAMGPDGKLYAIDGPRIRVIDLLKSPTADDFVTTLAGGGDGSTANGPNDTAHIGTIRSLTVASDGTVYFFDNQRLRKVDVSVPKTDPGYITTVIEGNRSAYVDGSATDASFLGTGDMGIDNQNRLYVMDAIGVRMVDLKRSPSDSHFVTTLVGRLLESDGGDAVVWGTRLAVAPNGTLILSGEQVNKIQKVTPW